MKFIIIFIIVLFLQSCTKQDPTIPLNRMEEITLAPNQKLINASINPNNIHVVTCLTKQMDSSDHPETYTLDRYVSDGKNWELNAKIIVKESK